MCNEPNLFNYHLPAGAKYYIPAARQFSTSQRITIRRALGLSKQTLTMLHLPQVQVIDNVGDCITELVQDVPLESISIQDVQ